jgi:hypothetical protein
LRCCRGNDLLPGGEGSVAGVAKAKAVAEQAVNASTPPKPIEVWAALTVPASAKMDSGPGSTLEEPCQSMQQGNKDYNFNSIYEQQPITVIDVYLLRSFFALCPNMDQSTFEQGPKYI